MKCGIILSCQIVRQYHMLGSLVLCRMVHQFSDGLQYGSNIHLTPVCPKHLDSSCFSPFLVIQYKLCYGPANVSNSRIDAGVWAQILNLAARLAAEVTAWIRRSSRTRSGRPLRRGILFKRLTVEMLLNKIVPLSQKVLYLEMPVAIESAEAENRLSEVWQ